MAFVRVEQRNAHLAGPVRLEMVNGREGKVAKATLTAISNIRRGGSDKHGEAREDESTAIQWTLWGKQAENASAMGVHLDVSPNLRNPVFAGRSAEMLTSHRLTRAPAIAHAMMGTTMGTESGVTQ